MCLADVNYNIVTVCTGILTEWHIKETDKK